MMDDRKLDELLDDASRTYRVPPEAPFDSIWQGIEAEAFQAPVASRRPAMRWAPMAMAIAASLVIGVMAGRSSVRMPAPTTLTTTFVALAGGDSLAPTNYSHTTEEFLGKTAVLLAALPADSRSGATVQLTGQATQLLTTVRLLIDSPVGGEPKMKKLLQDLELVLAQVARLPKSRQQDEMSLITNTLEERDLVPRLRSAVADLSGSDY